MINSDVQVDTFSDHAEPNLRRVLDKNADSIIVVNDDGHILYVNQAAVELFDRTTHLKPGELFGFPLSAGETTELDISRANGDRVVGEMRVVEIDWNGQEAFLASVRDVTGRKLTEETLACKIKERTLALETINDELTHMYEKASKSSQIRTQFIANVSHEVRTPLAGIVTSAELLQTAEGEESKELAGIVLSSAKQLLTLVESILDFSKLEAGKVAVSKKLFELKELVELVAESVYSSAKKKNNQITTEYDGELPELVVGDALKIRQVMLNLVNNAIKFTENGHILIKLGVEQDGQVDFVKVSVKDSGIGMSPGECNTIFQPFVQANKNIQNNYGGTGLGLSICKELAAAMGGNIGFCSEAGKGSTFWFTFPLEKATEETK